MKKSEKIDSDFMRFRDSYDSVFGEDRRKEGSVLNSFKDDSFPRFRCKEGCDFDLCDVCLQYLSKNEGEFDGNVGSDMQDMIREVRKDNLNYKELVISQGILACFTHIR